MTRRGKFDLRPGFLVVPEFSAKGGVSYQRQDLGAAAVGEKGEQAEFKTTRIIDDVELHKESKTIVAAAYYALDKFAASTPIGHWADQAMLDALRRELEPTQRAAEIFNELARSSGSAQRVTMQVFAIELRVDNREVAERIASSVGERLAELRGALAAGDAKLAEGALDRCKNVWQLATGIQADAARIAVAEARQRRRDLMKAIRAGGDPLAEGAKLDLGALDSAISLFAAPSPGDEDGGDEGEVEEVAS